MVANPVPIVIGTDACISYKYRDILNSNNIIMILIRYCMSGR